MAFNLSRKQKNKISLECGIILVDFVNADSLKDAILNLDESFRKIFNANIFNAQNEYNERKRDIKEAQQRLTILFDELQIDRALKNSVTMSSYNSDYYRLCHCHIRPDARSKNEPEVLAFLKTKANSHFEAALAFLVFQYIKDENRKPIVKCNYPKCRIYFIAQRNTARFCSNRHKMGQFRMLQKLLNFEERNKRIVPLSNSSKQPTKRRNPFPSNASTI